MTKRLEAVASEQQLFATAWFGLISDATRMTPAISGAWHGVDHARPLARHVVVAAYDPGIHDPSFGAISNQPSDKRFVVAALDDWARTGSMMWLQS
jgi:hypothetical protein